MNAPKLAGILGVVVGLVQLLLGVAVWSGLYVPWLMVHMLNGLVFTGIMAWVAILAGLHKPPIALQALAWAWVLVLPVFGIMHAGLMPGSMHWAIQVLHVGVGLAGIGIIQGLTKRMPATRDRSSTA